MVDPGGAFSRHILPFGRVWPDSGGEGYHYVPREKICVEINTEFFFFYNYKDCLRLSQSIEVIFKALTKQK